MHLTTYTKEPLTVIGQKVVEVQYKNQKKDLVIVIVEGNGPALLGIQDSHLSTWFKGEMPFFPSDLMQELAIVRKMKKAHWD